MAACRSSGRARRSGLQQVGAFVVHHAGFVERAPHEPEMTNAEIPATTAPTVTRRSEARGVRGRVRLKRAMTTIAASTRTASTTVSSEAAGGRRIVHRRVFLPSTMYCPPGEAASQARAAAAPTGRAER